VVAQYLSTVWPFASVGRGNGKDIQSVPFDCEVKARAGFQPKAVLEQIRKRTALSGELGFAVLRLNGQGENAAECARSYASTCCSSGPPAAASVRTPCSTTRRANSVASEARVRSGVGDDLGVAIS